MAQKATAANGTRTREDPRVTRTRTLIREALHDLMEQKPFSEVSVQDIAERATINRASFYAHFADKYFLLEDSTRVAYQAALAEHDAPVPLETSPFLEMIATATFTFIYTHKKCKLDKEFEPQISRVMQDALYNSLRSRLGESAALVVSSAMIGTAMRWRADRYSRQPEELVEKLVSVLTCGVQFEAAELHAAS